MEIYLCTNLKLLRKYKKLSQEDVAKALGLTRSSYSGYENGIAEPGLENFLKIGNFFKVPLDDLLTVDFSTLSEKELTEITKGIYADVKGKKLRILSTVITEENEEVIEMIPEKASAGYTTGYADPEYLKVLPTFQLPFLNKDRKYRSFPIKGDSMPPVGEGSFVVGEYVQNWESIKNNFPYVVITKEEGIVFKLVNKIKDREDVLQLSSTNPFYEPYFINVNDIIEIWKFVNYISPELPEVTISNDDLIKSVKGIQREVNEIKSYLKDS